MSRRNSASIPDFTWAVRLYLRLGALEGFAALAFLLLLPTDPKTRAFLGYSTQRLLLTFFALVGLAIFVFLLYRSSRAAPWIQRLGFFVFGQEKTVPLVITSLFVGMSLIIGWALIFYGEFMAQIQPAYGVRLFSLLAWAGLLVIQLCIIWFWIWKRSTFRLPVYALEVLLVLLLFLISFIPRAILTGYSLPYQAVWDEVVTYSQALDMLTKPGLHPSAHVPGYGQNSYGDLLVYVTTGAEVIGLLDGFRNQQVQSLEAYVSAPEGVSSIYGAVHESGLPLRMPRLALAFINSLAPLGIFFASRKIFKLNPWFAFSGALIYAIFSRDVLYYSSYILPDAFATTLFVFGLIAAWEAIEKTTTGYSQLIACGILMGMILAVNIRLALVFVVPFLVFVLSQNHTSPFTRLAFTSLSILSGFFISSPYSLIDLPNTLVKWTSFSWYHLLNLEHRIASLTFYLQGMFMPGFHASNIDSSQGSIGMGLLAGFLAPLGFGKLLYQKPRHMLITLIFGLLHIYMITPVVQRFTRHILILYPIVCITASAGLSVVQDGLHWLLKKISAQKKRSLLPNWQKAITFIVIVGFLATYANQIFLTYRYVRRIAQYKPVQIKVAEYLEESLQPGDKVGILDLIPWVESDLKQRDIPFARIHLTDSLDALKEQGITLVVGTDQIQADYGSTRGTLWENTFSSPQAKLAEFGEAPLQYAGYPVNNLYIFVVRMP